VRECQPGGHRGDLEGALLSPAVATLAGVTGDRDQAPGQGGELGEQAGLVALDREHVVRAAAGQVGSAGALGVHRVGGDDRPGDLDAVQQDGEHRDLVRLRADFHLAQDGAASMVEGSQQVLAGFTAAR
jgi:hypothetical protein